MSGRSRPARVRELPPHIHSGLSFPFGKVLVTIARQRDRRKPVGLRPKQGVTLLRPGVNGLKKPFVGKFGQRLSPVVANSCGVRPEVADESRQQRRQIVSTTTLKLGKQVGSPVRGVVFKAVAE